MPADSESDRPSKKRKRSIGGWPYNYRNSPRLFSFLIVMQIVLKLLSSPLVLVTQTEIMFLRFMPTTRNNGKLSISMKGCLITRSFLAIFDATYMPNSNFDIHLKLHRGNVQSIQGWHPFSRGSAISDQPGPNFYLPRHSVVVSGVGLWVWIFMARFCTTVNWTNTDPTHSEWRWHRSVL